MSITGFGLRSLLAAAALFAIVASMPAAAQDPQQSGAVSAARDWLVLLDAHDVKRMYETSGKRFRDGISAEQWAQVAESGREQFGAVKRRTLVSAQSPPETPNRPKGEFMTVVFRSDFEKRDVGQESLTVEREADGKWRVIGYLMR